MVEESDNLTQPAEYYTAQMRTRCPLERSWSKDFSLTFSMLHFTPPPILTTQKTIQLHEDNSPLNSCYHLKRNYS